MARDNADWDFWAAADKPRRAASAASRKVTASAKHHERMAKLPRVTEPKPRALRPELSDNPTIADLAPRKAPGQFPEAPERAAAAEQILGGQQNPQTAAAAQEAPRTRTVPPPPPKRPAPPVRPVSALDLPALGSINLPPEVLGFVVALYQAVVQGVRADVERAVRAEGRKQREVLTRDNKIRVERQQMEKRISTLLARASEFSRRPVPRRASIRPPSRMLVH
jgi:hypothetical protein